MNIHEPMAAAFNENLSPEELDALMEQIRSTGRSRETDATGTTNRDVIKYDLVGAKTVGRGKLPTLDLVNDRLARSIADTLSQATGHPVSVRAAQAELVKFVEFRTALPSPTAIEVLELQGVRGTGFLTLDPTTMYHVFDMLLGGLPTANPSVNGSDLLKRRGLTTVERRLLDRVARLVASEAATAWSALAPFGFQPLRIETEGRQVALFEDGEVMIDTVFSLEAAGCTGEMHLVFPLASVRHLEKKLTSGILDDSGEGAPSWLLPLTTVLRDVTVQVTVELGRSVISLRELMALQKGNIVRLDADPSTPLMVYVEGSPKLLGNPMVMHGNNSVEITSRAPADTGERMEPEATRAGGSR